MFLIKKSPFLYIKSRKNTLIIYKGIRGYHQISLFSLLYKVLWGGKSDFTLAKLYKNMYIKLYKLIIISFIYKCYFNVHRINHNMYKN